MARPYTYDPAVDPVDDALHFLHTQEWMRSAIFRPVDYAQEIAQVLNSCLPAGKQKRIGVRLIAPTANALSRSVGSFSFRRKYQIEISNHFFHLLLDAAEFYGARMPLPNGEGGLLPNAMSDKECMEELALKLIQHHEDRRLRWGHTRMDLLRQRRMQFEMRIPASQRRSPTIGLLFQQMVAFALGHEIGHIAHGHSDRTMAMTDDARHEEEYEADALAALLLFTLLERNRQSDATVAQAQEILGVVSTLTAVALLFGIHEAVEISGRALGRADDHGYPTARERWDAFYLGVTSAYGVPAGAFTEHISLLTPPVLWIEWFPAMARSIDWVRLEANYHDNPKALTEEFYAEIAKETNLLDAVFRDD